MSKTHEENPMNRLPTRLRLEPLIEVIWQVQFEPNPETSVGDLLPGLLYSGLKTNHREIQLHPLPIAGVPAAIVQGDPNLRHLAKYRLEEPDSPLLYQAGDRLITINCRKPYIGWEAFKGKVLVLIDILEASGLVPTPLRHSLRYIDLLALDPAPNLNALQIKLEVGRQGLSAQPVQLRTEIPDDGFTHVVQIVTPAEANLPDGPAAGTIVDLETFNSGKFDGWIDVRGQLDLLHQASKTLFFKKILTTEAINQLEPEY